MSDEKTTDPCPHCDAPAHDGDCATLDDWWLGLSASDQDDFIREAMQNVR